jgi:transcriptional regulator with XRE-family HTH domain
MSEERSANALDRLIGERVRAGRLALGMSQEHLADCLGVTFQQVQKYEKGVNRIAASRLFAIAVVLKIPIQNFFEGAVWRGRKAEAGKGVDGKVESALATREGAEVMSLFAAIKRKSVRSQAVAMLRALAKGD